MNRRLLLLSLITTALFMPAHVHAADIPKFCSAMTDVNAYKKHKKQAYEMLLQGQEGWVFRTATDFRSNFYFKKDGLRNFQVLQKALKEKNVELVIAYPPTRGLVNEAVLPSDRQFFKDFNVDAARKNYTEMLENTRTTGLHIVGITDFSKADTYFYKRDHHWTTYGAQAQAHALADYIQKNLKDVYKQIPEVQFKTNDPVRVDYEGTFKSVVEKLCDTKGIPSEDGFNSVTVLAGDQKADADSLFGDTKKPEIVLVGTSNSKSEDSVSNFEGWLKQYLARDVDNRAVSGGGLDTSIISYLNSKDFKEHPPKILIWEIPGYYNFGQRTLFEQAIPSIYGDCSTKSEMKQSVTIDKADTKISLFDKFSKNLSGNQYYLQLNFGAPLKIKRFKVFSTYNGGEKDEFKFDRSSRYPEDGLFYARFERGLTSGLTKVEIEAKKEMVGRTVEASVCKLPDTLMSKPIDLDPAITGVK
jgi:alginate biosynthesis protein AlgX